MRQLVVTNPEHGVRDYAVYDNGKLVIVRRARIKHTEDLARADYWLDRSDSTIRAKIDALYGPVGA